MKIFSKLLFVIFIGALVSCNTQKKAGEGTHYFGEKITDKNSVPVSKMYMVLETKELETMKIHGKIENICQVKGCWMNVTDDTGNSVFVKFKDYGFFMPLDASGREVIMEGDAYKEITTVDELRHYAEDEGKSEEEIMKITEPIEEYKFMAKGVILK